MLQLLTSMSSVRPYSGPQRKCDVTARGCFSVELLFKRVAVFAEVMSVSQRVSVDSQ